MEKTKKQCKDIYLLDESEIERIVKNAPLGQLMRLLPGGCNMFLQGLYFRFKINLDNQRGEKYVAAIWDWEGDRSTVEYHACGADDPDVAIRNIVRWFILDYIPACDGLFNNMIYEAKDESIWEDCMYIRNTLGALMLYR